MKVVSLNMPYYFYYVHLYVSLLIFLHKTEFYLFKLSHTAVNLYTKNVGNHVSYLFTGILKYNDSKKKSINRKIKIKIKNNFSFSDTPRYNS